MKRKLKALLAWLFVVSMLITMLPAAAFASNTTTYTGDTLSLQKMTATVSAATWPEGTEQPEDITITWANIYMPDQSGRVYIKFEFTAPESTNYQVYYDDSSSFSNPYLNSGVFPLAYSAQNYTSNSNFSFSLRIEHNYGATIYEEVTLTTYIAAQESFPMPLELLNTAPDYVSEIESNPYVNIRLPKGTPIENYSGNDLELRLVKDGIVYAVSTDRNPLNMYGPYYTRDTRYNDIFQSSTYNYYNYYAYMQLGANTYKMRTFDTGTYDAVIYEKASGTKLYTVPNIVKVVDLPVVSTSTYIYNTYCSNYAGSDTAYIQLSAYDADPDDFTITLADPSGAVIGTSADYRISDVYDGRFNAIFHIPLNNTVLMQDTEYTVSTEYSKGDFILTNSDSRFEIYANSSPNISNANFSSHYYASALVQFSGSFISGSKYKFELYHYGELLGTEYAYPDDTGLCDIVFLDANGDPIAIEPEENYELRCYYFAYGNWSNFQQYSLSNYYVYDFEFPGSSGGGDEVYDQPTHAYVSIGDGIVNGNIYVYRDNEDYDSFNSTTAHQFAVSLIDLLGNEIASVPMQHSKYSYSDSIRYYIKGDLPANIADGFYHLKLYHNGREMLNANGVNIAYDGYPNAAYHDPTVYEYQGNWLGLTFIYEHSVNFTDSYKSITNDFYALGNNSATPDLHQTYTSSDLAFTEAMAAKLNPFIPYVTVSTLDGKKVASSYNYFYYLPESKLNELEDALYSNVNSVPKYSITASAASENGSVSILSPFTGDSSSVYAYSEVFINAVPAEGYRVKPGSVTVNGKPITGRSFMAANNAAVSVEFEKIPEIKYGVSASKSSYGYMYTEKTAYAEGETVTVYMVPDSGYKVSPYTSPYYYLEGSGNYNMTENEDGTWSFIMPAGEVTLYAYFTKKTSSTIRIGNYDSDIVTVEFTDEDGNFITPSSTKVLEGTKVYAKVYLSSEYTLNDFYSSSVTPEYDADNDVYYFIMPDNSPYFYIEYSQKTPRSINISGSVNGYIGEMASSAYPDELIWVYPVPDDGYRTSRLYYTDDTGSTTTIHADELGVYSFYMPDSDITLHCEFEEIPTTVPGGTVSSAAELQTALGGSYFASLSGNTVTLLRDITLSSPLSMIGGNVTLDTNGFSINGELTGTAASMISVSGTADFTISNRNDIVSAILPDPHSAASHTIHVTGGTLRLLGPINIISYADDTVRVDAGLVTIDPAEDFRIEVINHDTGSPIHITGTGSLTVNDVLANSYVSYPALFIDNTSGTVNINGGTYEASNAASLKVSGTTDLSISAMDVHASHNDPNNRQSVSLPAGKGLRDYLADDVLVFDTTNGNVLLDDIALSASEYSGYMLIGTPVTVTYNITGSGTVESKPELFLPGMHICFRAEPAPGYTVSKLRYDDGIGGSDLYSSNNEYYCTPLTGNITVYADFVELPEQYLLQNPVFSIHAESWSGNLIIPPEFNGVYSLNYNTAFVRIQLCDESGNIVLAQECRNGYSYFYIFNPGTIPAGKYKMFVTVGDDFTLIPLGYQTITLTDAYVYNAHSNRQLTTASTGADIYVTIQQLPLTALPDALTLDIIHGGTGEVIASSDSYSINNFYSNDKEGTAATGHDDNSDYLNKTSYICFSFNFDRRLDGDTSYYFRLSSSEYEFLDEYGSNMYVTSGISMYDSVFNADTLTWTSLTENLPAGSYSTYTYQWDPNTYTQTQIYGPTMSVDENGTASIVFSGWPFEEGSNSLSLYFNYNGFENYIGIYNNEPVVGNRYYESNIENAVYVSYSDSYQTFDYVIPADYDTSEADLIISVPDCDLSGTYSLVDHNSNVVAAGSVSDLSQFTVHVSNIMLYSNYYMTITANAENTDVRGIGFQFRSGAALGIDKHFYGDLDGDQITFKLSHTISANDFCIGYYSFGEKVELPFTMNADNTVTVDVSSVPCGQWKPWATQTMRDKLTGEIYDESLTIGNWSFRKGSPLSRRPDISVSKLTPEETAEGVYTADVVYENGTPDTAVNMSIYLATEKQLVYLRTVNIGTGSYTISSDTLGLAGSYIFFFTLADGTLIDIESGSFGKPPVVTVTFIDWDSSILSEQTIDAGSAATAPTVPARKGYDFIGWSCDISSITRNTAVYARYRQTAFNVHFIVDGTVYEEYSLVSGTIDAPAAPIRDGYNFLGWRTAPNNTVYWDFASDEVAANTVLYARWEKITYSVTIAKGSESYISMVSDKAAGDRFRFGAKLVNGKRLSAVKITFADGSIQQLGMEDFYNTFVFTMPAQDITVEAILTDSCSIILTRDPHAYIPQANVSIHDSDGNWIIPESFFLPDYSYDNLLPGTYFINVEYIINNRSYYLTYTVELSDGGTETIELVFDRPIEIVGSVTNPTGSYGWLDAYDENGYWCASARVNSAGGFVFDSLAADRTYTLYYTSDNGSIPIIEGGTFTAQYDGQQHSITLKAAADLFVTVHTTENKPAHIVYFDVYRDGEWVNWGSAAGTDGTVCWLEDVITEPGEYSIEMYAASAANYTAIYFAYSANALTVSADDIDSGSISMDLNYFYADTNCPDALTGSGNIVALDRSEAYPGDVIGLNIRYSNNSYNDLRNVRFRLDLNDSIELYGDSSAVNTVNSIAAYESGEIALALTVTKAAEGTVQIPVMASVNGGEEFLFGTAVFTVPEFTIESHTEGPGRAYIHGKAAPGSMVLIKNSSSGELLAAVTSTGIFSAKIMYNEAISVVAVCGELVSNVVELPYNMMHTHHFNLYQIFTNDIEKANHSMTMGAYVFSEYVDTDLMGFDMQLEISAGLHGEVDSISFDFCGNTYDAKITGDTKCSALLTGWGGSGLKPLTANIVWNDGCETSVIIAYVNLLIDPSGVVYGIDNKPLENASVTLQVLKNGIWRDWDAEAYGQSNYLNTGKDGKYGWFVPAGTYRVLATAFGYEDYSSEPVYGNIQIPPPRMDIDIYMQPKAMTITTAASENGAIGVASSAHPGDIVTVSDLSGAASGYRLNSVSVVTQWGGVINVTSTGDGSYQFIMPMAAVTVKGNYVPMAEPEVSISQTGSDITATAENLNEDGILVIALYNKAGKQISVHFGKANSDSLTVAIGDAVRAKAFLLNNTDSFTPITGSGIWADITK